MITNEGGTQNASVPPGCRIWKTCLPAAQTDSGARLTGSGAKLGADRAHVREKRLPSPRCCASWAHEDLNLGPLPCQGVWVAGLNPVTEHGYVTLDFDATLLDAHS